MMHRLLNYEIETLFKLIITTKSQKVEIEKKNDSFICTECIKKEDLYKNLL